MKKTTRTMGTTTRSGLRRTRMVAVVKDRQRTATRLLTPTTEERGWRIVKTGKYWQWSKATT